MDYSFFDIKLLFPNITEAQAFEIEFCLSLWTIVSLIVLVIAEWKLFKKFGEKSWKSLIPYYNLYIVYKHTWNTKTFWIYFIFDVLFKITNNMSEHFAENRPDSMWMTLLLLIALPFGIVSAVCAILYSFRLAEAFGKGKAFSVGLLLLDSVFMAILGMGKQPYLGNCSAISTENGTEKT